MSLPRQIARAAYRAANGLVAAASLAAGKSAGPPRVFYGGAGAGDVGGPLVKVRLLRARFPEERRAFNLLYLLSNALYLPDWTIAAIRRRDVPIVLNQNGLFYPAWYPDGWERENLRMSCAYHAATHVFWQSEFCRRCADMFLGPRGGAGEILFNGVDTGRFAPSPERVRDPGRQPRILLTGKVMPPVAYRVTRAVEGLALARRGGLDATMRIAGWLHPAVAAETHTLVARLGLDDAVRVTGAYSSADAPAIYRDADVYLMLKHNDPCPNVVLEALASGLPVVYSASGGVPELVGEAGVGLPVEERFDRFDAPSADSVADGLARALASRETMAALARRRAVERFSLPAWLDRHAAVFERLAKGLPA